MEIMNPTDQDITLHNGEYATTIKLVEYNHRDEVQQISLEDTEESRKKSVSVKKATTVKNETEM